MVQTDYWQNVGVGIEVGIRGIESPLSFSVAGSVSSLNSSIHRNSFYLLQGKVGYRLTRSPEADTKISIRAIGSPMISRDRFTCAAGGRISYCTPSGTEYSIEPLIDVGGHFYLGLAIAMFDLSPKRYY